MHIHLLKLILTCLTLSIFSTSCKRNFQFSVLEVKPLDRDVNQRSIDKISKLTQKDTFNFLVISDSQVAYDELQSFVEHANHNYNKDQIAFKLHAGDFTDYGANFEYNLYYDDAKELKFPVVGAIGNHDMLSNGREIYRKLFGDENFSFEYGKNKFMIFNSNSREVGFNKILPDLAWLRAEIKNVKESNIFFLSHVAPMSLDFDPELKVDFIELLDSSSTTLSIHGHSHSFEYGKPFNNDTKYLIAPTLQKKQYVMVSVSGKNIQVQQKFF